VDLLSVIRRWHGRDKLPIREITRRTGLSRNTVRKYLATGEVSPQYPARKSVSKLDPYAETLASWLKREASRSRKRRRNLKQLHRDLAALGFDGSYDRVAAFARDWRRRERERANRASRGTFVPLTFAPVKPSSSTGAKTGSVSVASRSSCRWRTSSCATAGLSFSAPIRCRLTRCCSMLITTPSAYSVACPSAASMTT